MKLMILLLISLLLATGVEAAGSKKKKKCKKYKKYVEKNCARFEMIVTFPDRGTNYPKGIITLVQTAATGDLAITTSLTGLEGAALGNKWHGALPRAYV